MEIEKKLNSLGFQLPSLPKPAANYITHVRVGNLIYLGGTTGRINGVRKYNGVVGETVTVEQAYEVARDCALNHLAMIKETVGDLDKVERIVKVTGYVTVPPGFKQMPQVINGQSDLLVQLWGERGQHARAALGVVSLGADAPVETDMIVQVRD